MVTPGVTAPSPLGGDRGPWSGPAVGSGSPSPSSGRSKRLGRSSSKQLSMSTPSYFTAPDRSNSLTHTYTHKEPLHYTLASHASYVLKKYLVCSGDDSNTTSDRNALVCSECYMLLHSTEHLVLCKAWLYVDIHYDKYHINASERLL